MTDDTETGISLHALFEVGVTLGDKLDASVASHNRLIRLLEKTQPIMFRPTASAFIPEPTAPTVINLGTPSQGTFWEVRKVCVGGLEADVAVAGTAGLYVSAMPSVDGAGFNNLEDRAGGLPNIGYYPSGTIYTRAGEYLFVVVFSGTPLQQYVANAFVRIYSDTQFELYDA